jgi:tetratricopeptide (TPR) repeat protein
LAANRNRIVAAAQRFLQKAQYDKALAEYQRLLDDDPRDVRTLLKVGDIYVKMGNAASAADTFIRVATRYHEDGSAHKAIAVYKQVLKLVPERIDALFTLSELYVEIGLVTEAAAGFSELAKAYEQLGRTHEMCAMYRRVVELEPENIPSRVRLAELFAREEMRDEAIAEFRVILENLRKVHRRADFIKVAERLLFYEPTELSLIKELARLYADKGDGQRALARLQQGFRIAPRDPEILELLADTFRDLGQITKTATVLRELASVYAEGADVNRRDAALRRLLEIEPGDEDARRLLITNPAQHAVAVAVPAMPAAGFSGTDGFGDAPAGAVDQPLSEGGEVEKRVTEIEIYAKYGLREQAIREGEALAVVYPREERVARLLARIYGESGADALAAHALARFGEAMGAELGARARALAEEVLRLDGACGWAARALGRGDGGAPRRALGGANGGRHETEVDAGALVLDIDAAGAAAAGAEDDGAQVAIDADLDDKEGDVEFVAARENRGSAGAAGDREPAMGMEAGDDEGVGLIPVETPTVPHPSLTVSPDASAVLEEVDFFLLQGLRDEALSILREASHRLPNDVSLTIKLREVGMAHGTSADEPTVGEVVAQVPGASSREGSDAVLVGDLGGEQMGEAETLVADQSAETHFDLGRAYQEMSLWDEAVDEYRRALREPHLAVDAGMAMALCLRQTGRHPEALREIDRVLANEALAVAKKRAAIFERAAVFEAMGDMSAALNGYRSVAHEDPKYRDVEARMHRLAAMLSGLGGGGAVSAEGTPKARG